MSNKWLFFPSPVDTGLDLIAKAASWQMINSGGVLTLMAAGVTQGLWPTIYSQWGQHIALRADRTLTGFMVWSTVAGWTAFRDAHTGAQGMLLTHRGKNGSVSDPAKYYLWVGTYSQISWTGRYGGFVSTTRWMGYQMTGHYGSTNPSELRALNTIGLQTAAVVASVSGSPVDTAVTGSMGTTTTGSLPTGMSSMTFTPTLGVGFVFGSTRQRDTFVSNYPAGTGTFYHGVEDTLGFTALDWSWNTSTSSTIAYISQADHEYWHSDDTRQNTSTVFAVGDDVQLIHTA